MKKCVFSGACTALVTPFLDGKVNYPMLEILLARQLLAGIRSVVLAGTTGESPTLSDGEKAEMIRRCKAFAGKDCTIIAGTGSNNTSHAVALSEAAAEAGADALLVVSPYYNKASPEGLIAHYRAICQAVQIPVIAYNVPSRTGMDICAKVCKELSELNHMAGIKEASGNIVKVAQILETCPKGFHVWSGNDDQVVPVMSLGGKGVISVVSNVTPELMCSMTEAAINGDYETAAEIQLRLMPLIRALFNWVNPIPVKAAMRLIGYDCGICRLPLTDLPAGEAEKLKSILLQV